MFFQSTSPPCFPAGYVGGAFWGAAFVALSGNRIGATVAGCIFTAALLTSLRYSPNSTVVMLSVGFTVITVAAMLIDWLVFTPIIEYVVLYYGVFIGVYSVRDIYDDLVVRTAEGSDAVACYKLCPLCLPRCVGVQWGIIAMIFQVLGLYVALCWLSSTTD
jgi:Peptidase M50B-like